MLGRRPTDAELAIYSVMWSEHCSYKSSRVHLRQFADKAPPTGALLAGIGQNAGVVDIGQGYAVTFKIESHNHPSYVEPFQGAATGVGGIVRDILAMGARPVAVMDALRFGPADAPDTRRVLPGVVGGISFYGNCLGLPNIGGELAFDPCYAGNPLVNALCVGVMRHEDLKLAAASGPGNQVVLFGASTGPDGIGGASVLASASFGGGRRGARKRPSVQVGDPFMEKLLIECCLELFAAGLVGRHPGPRRGRRGLRHHRAGRGRRRGHAGPPGRGAAAGRLARPGRDPDERVAGTDDGDRPARRARALPGHLRQVGRPGHGDRRGDRHRAAGDDLARRAGRGHPAGQRRRRGPGLPAAAAAPGRAGRAAGRRPGPARPPAAPAPSCARRCWPCSRAPDAADKTWVTEQYDRYVRGNTVLAMPQDAGLIRVDEQTGLGVAMATDGNGRYCRLDPYAGTQLALAEAYRNVAATGARPLAVTNCLNFGSPEDPAVMWQFSEAVRGLADGCLALGIPVTGGNVSFYNQTAERRRSTRRRSSACSACTTTCGTRLSIGFGRAGRRVVLLGATARRSSAGRCGRT